MTYADMFSKVKSMLVDADVSDINEHLAYQFNVTGEAEVITDDGVKRTTLFVKDGIITGAVIINDKASMMKIKAMIGTRR